MVTILLGTTATISKPCVYDANVLILPGEGTGRGADMSVECECGYRRFVRQNSN